MDASFNVLSEPWIPVVDADGLVRQVGILTALTDAHRLTGISDASPAVEFGLYRLLLAFAIDAFELTSLNQVEDRLETGAFDPDALVAYADRVGWQRFDLFDREHPFLQTPPTLDEDNRCSIVRLYQHLPSGSFSTHFFHAPDDTHAFCPADCARALVTMSAFMTAGGAGYSPSVNGAPPWYVLLRGHTLFETLVLNAYALENRYSDEPPAWRSTVALHAKDERSCGSFMEALTWRPRRVRLVPDHGGMCTYCGATESHTVRSIVFGPGMRSAGGWIDPQVAYRISSDGPAPLRAQEGRELWRDVGALLLLKRDVYTSENGKISYQRPLIVDQYLRLQEERCVAPDRPLCIEVYGVRTDMKMKIFEWQHETLALPADLAADSRLALQVQQCMDHAGSVARTLDTAIKRVYPREGKSNEAAWGTIIGRVRQAYWTALRVKFDNQLIPALLGQDRTNPSAEGQLREEWATICQRVALIEFDRISDSLGSGAEALAKQVKARDFLSRFTSPSGDVAGQKAARGREKVS